MEKQNRALSKGTTLRGKVYKYRIERVLGQGAFGITYLASTSMPGPLGEVTVQVAVKEFFAKELDSRMEDGTVTARTLDGVAHKYARAFLREAENLSKMRHPGIVNILEFFEDKGTCYYSMEYLSGGNLDDKVRDSGIPEREALPLIERIGEALSYMHECKVMHLDLKPKNVMLKADGTPVVIDFGLSKQYDGKGEPESSTTIGLGTPGYAPIEQANQTSGRMFQPTLDIYALGATLFKMLTGNTPPTASDIFNDGFPTDSLMEKGVSSVTIEAIQKAMSAAKKDRPQSVADFLSLLGKDRVSDVHPRGDSEETTVKPVKQDGKGKEENKEEKAVGKKSKAWLLGLIGGVVAAAVIAWLIFGGKGKGGGGEEIGGADLPAVAASVDTVSADSGPVLPGSIKISSTPSGAAIWLDGKNTKKSTPEILEDIAPGKHSVKLVLEGYEDASGSVTVMSGQRANLSKTMNEKPAQIPAQQTATPVQPTVETNPAVVEKPTAGTLNGHDWVDLGLSVMWATCNVGASSPSDYGDYYAWGETATKSNYDWSTYKWCKESYDSLTKYNTDNSYGAVDNKKRLEREDDVANAKWGGKWRMPTDSEIAELREKCDWKWTEQGGRKGYRVTSRTNGNSIFFPAAGYRSESTLYYAGSIGYYCSSSLRTSVPYDAWRMYFNSSGVYKGSYHRCYGFSVRPVTE